MNGVLKDYGPQAMYALIIAIGLDLILIGLFIVFGAMDVISNTRNTPLLIDITEESSIAAIYLYIKWAIISGLLWIAYLRSNAALFSSFSFTFLLILLDDSLQLHERGGAWLSGWFNIESAFGLRGQDFGELIVWASMGIFVVAALFYGYLKRTQSSTPFFYYFSIVFVALIIVAIGLDMFNALPFLNIETQMMDVVAGIVIILEDGSEMLVASFGVAGAVAANQASRSILCDRKRFIST